MFYFTLKRITKQETDKKFTLKRQKRGKKARILCFNVKMMLSVRVQAQQG